MDQARDAHAVEELRAQLFAAVRTLREAGARDEAVADYLPRRRRFGIPLQPVLRPAGRVWRLGVLLLSADGGLRATGQLVRATPPGRTQYVSDSAETRRAFRAAAERGHIAPGETVNFDAPPIHLGTTDLEEASGPLFLRDGGVFVRWSARGMPTDARTYLAERVRLLANPPEGT